MSHFGNGVLTFPVGYLFRTDPGVAVWARGIPNYAKDGIVALDGVIETDWLCFTFTMNWQCTRPGLVVFEGRAVLLHHLGGIPRAGRCHARDRPAGGRARGCRTIQGLSGRTKELQRRARAEGPGDREAGLAKMVYAGRKPVRRGEESDPRIKTQSCRTGRTASGLSPRNGQAH